MAEEFILETRIDLDDDDARKKAQKFQDDYKKIELKATVLLGDSSKKFDSLKARIKTIKKEFQEAFKVDQKTLSDIEKITAELTKLAQNLTNLKSQINQVKNADNSLNNSKGESTLVAKYKIVQDAIDKINNKMRTGMSADSFKKAQSDIVALENELKQLESLMTAEEKRKLSLYDFKRDKQQIAELISNMNKVETKINEVQSKASSLKFSTNTSNFSDITNRIESIRNQVKNDWKLGFDSKDALSQLQQVEKEISNLKKVDTLKEKFENVKNTIREAFDDSIVQQLESEINGLVSQTKNLDGSFESTFNEVDSLLKEITNDAKLTNSELIKTQNIEQSKLIAEYKQLEDSIARVNNKLKQQNLSSETESQLTAELSNLTMKLDAVKQKITDVNSHKIEAIDSKGSKQELDSLISELVKVDLKSQEVRNSLKNIRVTVDNQNTINQLIAKLDSLDATKSLKMDFSSANKELTQIEKAISNLKKVDSLTTKFEKLEASIRKAFGDSVADKLKTDLQNLNSVASVLDNTFESTFANLKAEMDSIGSKANTINSNLKKIASVETSFERVKEAIRNAFGDTKVQEFESRIESLRNAAKSMDATFDTLLDGFKNDLASSSTGAAKINQNLKKVETLRGTFNALKSDIEKAFGTQAVVEFEAMLQVLESEARNLGGSFDTIFAEWNTRLRQMNRQMTANQTVMKTVNKFWMDFSGSLRTFTLGNILGNSLTTSIYKIKDVFSELDAAMTDLKKVADIGDINTIEKLDAIQDKAMEMSKQVGMSTADTIEGIASALQSGVDSMEDAMEIAKNAMMLANVGDLTQDQASSGLNTIVNSFNLDALKKTKVQVGDITKQTTELSAAMDKLNYASNTQAIDMQNLIEAFQGGGAVLANYGVEIGDATAMITAANTSLQNGSRVGNGLKSIGINITGLKVSAKEGTMELNKTAKALKNIAGIDIYADEKTGDVKGYVEILDEVKSKWAELKEDEQLALSEAIAGKQQATVFQALMQNYDTFLELREEFANGEQFGSAEREKQHSPYVEKSA